MWPVASPWRAETQGEKGKETGREADKRGTGEGKQLERGSRIGE